VEQNGAWNSIGEQSLLLGYGGSANSDKSSSVGYANVVSDNFSSAFGYTNEATGFNSSALGDRNKAIGSSSSAFGYDNDATAGQSSAFGYQNEANMSRSSAFGYRNDAFGQNSTAVGYSNVANMTASSAIGFDNTASAENSSAAGSLNQATEHFSNAYGYSNEATGQSSSAFGYDNTASGLNANAFGYSNEATGNSGSALGYTNEASENNTSAVGYLNAADAINASAFGYSNDASGTNASAFGFNNTANAANATAFGHNLFVDVYQMTSVGSFNENPDGSSSNWVASDPIFMVGNGEDIFNRSSALTILKNGRVGIGTSSPDQLLEVDGGSILASGNITANIDLIANDDLIVDDDIFLGSNERIFDGGPNEISIFGKFTPSIDNDESIGKSTRRWSEVWAADGTINTSDRKHKTNIQKLDYGLDEIIQLKPVRFRWKDKKEHGEKLGLIAQDLLEVLPEVVKKHEWVVTSEEEGAPREKVAVENLGVFYSDIIPVLIHGIQEQQALIQELEAEIDDLKAMNERILALEQQLSNQQTILLDGNADTDQPQLHQNEPNPFTEGSRIRYFLPKEVTVAYLLITAADGKEIQRFKVDGKGAGELFIRAGTYPAGTYNYSLLIDGQIYATKRMVLTK